MTERGWSAQFIAMLESLRMPAQFQLGRRYARAGHIRQLNISASLATALVLDDDGQTYRAKIAVRAFSHADWNRIERVLGDEAIHAAKLLAGQLPPDLDRILADLGLTLFPDTLTDLALDCTCPDWRIPCGHLAAACYALAESFDSDPFGILAWRGRSREELLARLRSRHVQPEPAVVRPRPEPSLADFWTAGPRQPAPTTPVAGTVRRPDALLDQLDPLRLNLGRHDVVDLLRPLYRRLGENDG